MEAYEKTEYTVSRASINDAKALSIIQEIKERKRLILKEIKRLRFKRKDFEGSAEAKRAFRITHREKINKLHFLYDEETMRINRLKEFMLSMDRYLISPNWNKYTEHQGS